MENTKHTPTPWRQGVLLMTNITKRWSPQQIEQGEREEKCRVFANFSSLDKGRSRELIAVCATPENAHRVVICVNKFSAFTTEEIEAGVDISALSTLNSKLIEALKEISEGKGRYNEDRFEHAKNTIEDMKELALEALKLTEKQ